MQPGPEPISLSWKAVAISTVDANIGSYAFNLERKAFLQLQTNIVLNYK